MQTNRSRRPLRAGFTMIELLVSMAISLVVVFALVEFMKRIGDTVTDGRAMIDLATQLRGVRQRLHEDLQSLTVQARPWAEGNGYLEINEFPLWDGDADGNNTADFSRAAPGNLYDIETNGGNTLFGDWDDVLAGTMSAGIEPFVGQVNGGAATSQLAEVVWFCGFDDLGGTANQWDANEPRYLHRRVLLILPGLSTTGFPDLAQTYTSQALAQAGAMQFWQTHDLSVRVHYDTVASNWKLVPNSLSDLSRRENRFAHQVNSFPFRLDFDPRFNSYYVLGKHPSASTARAGEDIMLSRLLAFDVQVFDPDAVIGQFPSGTDPTGAAITPDSREYGNSGMYEIGRGAFVDLGYAANSVLTTGNRYGRTLSPTPAGVLAYAPNSKSGFGNNPFVWDAWTTAYESDGIDQNGGGADLGTDGLDNDNANGVDDVGERDTSPPYPVPLRGIRVTLRIYDPSTRQVRQGTVSAEFTPE